MEERPWSGQTLKKLSRHLRDGTQIPADLPTYDDVMLWYDELVDHVIKEIDSVNWAPLLGDRYRKPTGRAKTVQTLCEKLQRMPTTHLPYIQDIAGVRLEMSMSLMEQDAVADRLAQLFNMDPAKCIVDLRPTPHAGYRAVHVLVDIPDKRGRAEIQVRTKLQGEWANMYEELADLAGREIRYGGLPEDDPRIPLISELQGMSVGMIADLEETSNALFIHRFLVSNMPVLPEHEPLIAEARAIAQTTAAESLKLAGDVERMESDLVNALQLLRAKLREIAMEARK